MPPVLCFSPKFMPVQRFCSRKAADFGLRVAGEDALLVTANAQYALQNAKSAKSPYLFTDDGADAIKDAVIHIQPCTPILFTQQAVSVYIGVR